MLAGMSTTTSCKPDLTAFEDNLAGELSFSTLVYSPNGVLASPRKHEFGFFFFFVAISHVRYGHGYFLLCVHE